MFSATPVAQIEKTARMGVGPDERLSGQSPEHAVRGYWLPAREILSGQHVMVPFDELQRLPHGVVLGLRLRVMLSAAGVYWLQGSAVNLDAGWQPADRSCRLPGAVVELARVRKRRHGKGN
ncbi:hypothetical protein [Glutamicibacter protophormiae]